MKSCHFQEDRTRGHFIKWNGSNRDHKFHACSLRWGAEKSNLITEWSWGEWMWNERWNKKAFTMTTTCSAFGDTTWNFIHTDKFTCVNTLEIIWIWFPFEVKGRIGLAWWLSGWGYVPPSLTWVWSLKLTGLKERTPVRFRQCPHYPQDTGTDSIVFQTKL